MQARSQFLPWHRPHLAIIETLSRAALPLRLYAKGQRDPLLK